MAILEKKPNSILLGNLNSGHSYLITTVLTDFLIIHEQLF